MPRWVRKSDRMFRNSVRRSQTLPNWPAAPSASVGSPFDWTWPAHGIIRLSAPPSQVSTVSSHNRSRKIPRNQATAFEVGKTHSVETVDVHSRFNQAPIKRHSSISERTIWIRITLWGRTQWLFDMHSQIGIPLPLAQLKRKSLDWWNGTRTLVHRCIIANSFLFIHRGWRYTMISTHIADQRINADYK